MRPTTLPGTALAISTFCWGTGGFGSDLPRAYYNEENFLRLERAQSLAERLGATANEVALAYLLGQPFPVIPIIGPRTTEQLLASLRASELQLSPAELAELDGEMPG